LVLVAALTASHLTRRFGTRVAVDDVSFDLAGGEIFALLGPNGAGKTTTLRMLAGLISPTSGAVQIDGTVMNRDTGDRLRGAIGFLTEAPGLWDRLTVRQNLLTYARLHGLAAPAHVVDAALDLFDIRDRANEAAAQLSKGLKQRVALARTLLHDPRIIMLDEPTSGLDPQSARDVRELILRLRDERRALILSTHNLDEVERVADRVAVLKGRLVAVDTPNALRTRLFGTRVRVALAGTAEGHAGALRAQGARDIHVDGNTLSVALDAGGLTTPQLVRLLVERGADVLSVMPEEAPLEEVYLRLLGGES
jgi:ABC-2 type transport system ATP-binding protein